MRFVIRADASAKIGAGHVMRVCAIAEELIARGQEVIFVGESKSLPWVLERVRGLGFSEIYEYTEEFQPDSKSDILILDSYEIDPFDVFLLRENWLRIVSIVDDATPGIFADLYIHPGSGTKWRPPTSTRHFQFLSGIEFIPIRKTLQTVRLRRQTSSKAELRILVIGGGSDSFDFCGALGSKLHKLTEQFSVTLFVQPNTSLPLDQRFTTIIIGAKIEKFLSDADLIFTTAGTSSWEFLSCGFPVGLACAVDNQVANYQYQTGERLAIGIGKTNYNGDWELDANAIQKLVANAEIRAEISQKAAKIVDGQGCFRIVDAIIRIGTSLS